MSIFEAVILAIIEGITEFLPVSSTGHMIIASTIMGIEHESFTKLFTVAIQLGAILSVVVLYWKRFFQTKTFYYKLFVAFIPAAIFGVLFSDQIDEMLESATIVAVMLILGGIVFLFVDKWFNEANKAEDSTPSYAQSFIIGCFQCLAMVPGVSRSAATIIGGLTQKMNRKSAAEFSFFLAVPTMFAATAKKMLDYYQEGILLQSNEIVLLAIGNVVAFIVAILAIKFFISFLTKYGFKVFGYYIIALGILILILLSTGVQIEF